MGSSSATVLGTGTTKVLARSHQSSSMVTIIMILLPFITMITMIPVVTIITIGTIVMNIIRTVIITTILFFCWYYFHHYYCDSCKQRLQPPTGCTSQIRLTQTHRV